MSTDRAFFVGILAWKHGLITRQQLMAAVATVATVASVEEDSEPTANSSLTIELRDSGYVSQAQADALDELADAYLSLHNGDLSATIAHFAHSVSFESDTRLLQSDDDRGKSEEHGDREPSDASQASHQGHEGHEGTQGFSPTVVEPARSRFELTPTDDFIGLSQQAGAPTQIQLAYDHELGRPVLLKHANIIPASENADDGGSLSSTDALRHEAIMTAKLEHPGIVSVYAYDDAPRGQLALRHLQGRTLADEVAAHAPLSASVLRPLLPRIASVCRAVAYAHSRSVLHGSIDPTNIVLGEFGETILMNWDAARSLTDSDTTSQIDIAAIGELLTWLLAQCSVQRGPLIRPLQSICEMAKQASPDNGYQRADELAVDIEHLLADQPVTAHDETIAERFSRWIRQNPAISTATVVAMIVAILAIMAVAQMIGTKNTELAEVNSRKSAASRLAQEDEAAAIEQRTLALSAISETLDNVQRRMQPTASLEQLRALKATTSELLNLAKRFSTDDDASPAAPEELSQLLNRIEAFDRKLQQTVASASGATTKAETTTGDGHEPEAQP